MNKLLINPFAIYSERSLILVGFVSTALGSYFAYLMKTRFDGILDLHFLFEVLPWQPLVDNVINILCLFSFLMLLATYLNSKTRGIDILAVVLIARIPYYFLPAFNINSFMSNLQNDLRSSLISNQFPEISAISITLLILFSLLSLLFLVWYMLLLFNGFRVASNAKGATSILFFVGAILLAEVSSIFLTFKITSL